MARKYGSWQVSPLLYEKCCNSKYFPPFLLHYPLSLHSLFGELVHTARVPYRKRFNRFELELFHRAFNADNQAAGVGALPPTR